MLNSPGMAPPVKRGPRFSQLRFLPIVLTTTLTAALPSSSGSVAVMFVSVRLPPMWLNSTPSHSGMTSHKPVTVLLAWFPDGISPPLHVYGDVPDGAALAIPVIPSNATSMAAPNTIRDLILPPSSVDGG